MTNNYIANQIPLTIQKSKLLIYLKNEDEENCVVNKHQN